MQTVGYFPVSGFYQGIQKENKSFFCMLEFKQEISCLDHVHTFDDISNYPFEYDLHYLECSLVERTIDTIESETDVF